jgi:hypothetical protein
MTQRRIRHGMHLLQAEDGGLHGRRSRRHQGETGQRQAAGRRRQRVKQVLHQLPDHFLLEVVERLAHHWLQRRRPLQRFLLLLLRRLLGRPSWPPLEQ